MRISTKMTRTIRQACGFMAVLLAAGLAAGCGANESVLRSGKETPTLTNADREKTTFAKDLEAMQTAGFGFIYVLRRKDSGPIDAADVAVIKLQTVDTNRRVKSDDGRAVIIGSNYPIPPNNLAALYDRFAVENHSETPAADSNGNTNSNK